jgi:acetyl esterase/lipase
MIGGVPDSRPSDLRVRRFTNIEYGKGGKSPLLLDLYLPEKDAKKRPVIVWVHGGGWKGGNKDEEFPQPTLGPEKPVLLTVNRDGWSANGRKLPLVPMWLVGKGFAVASINYRLSDEAKFPAQIEDCKAAVRWLRANAEPYHLDPRRIGAWGISAGGHLVSLLGTTGGVRELEGRGGSPGFSSRVQAVCNFVGPGDLGGYLALRGNPAHDWVIGFISDFLGGPLDEKKDVAAKASPASHASKDDPPFLLVFGEVDPLVPVSQGEALYRALRKVGVNVTFHVAKGAGHVPITSETDGLVERFFLKHLK